MILIWDNSQPWDGPQTWDGFLESGSSVDGRRFLVAEMNHRTLTLSVQRRTIMAQPIRRTLELTT